MGGEKKQGTGPKVVEGELKRPAKADYRHVAPEARVRIAYQTRHMSAEAARKEWGVTPTVALETLVKEWLKATDARLANLEDSAMPLPKRPFLVRRAA